MISEFIREQKWYSFSDLYKLLQCSEEQMIILIRKLKDFGILKSIKSSYTQDEIVDLLEDNSEFIDIEIKEKNSYYAFTYVGIIVIESKVLKCYPKYLLHTEKPINEFKQIIKVLEKCNLKKQTVRIFNEDEESDSFNLLGLILFLLQDYFENDVYSNTDEIIEYNGTGEILWDRTINDTVAVLSDNRPFYIELRTRKKIDNNFDYFKRLHKCIITTISKELKEAELLELFDLIDVELTDEKLDSFGDREYILYRIEKELNLQYNTRKQLVLKSIYKYIDKQGSLSNLDYLSLYGTNKFNLIWEQVCAEIIDNKLYTTLNSINIPVDLKEKYRGSQTLIDLIEKPLWTYTGKTAKDTLKPDFISISKVDNDYIFIIFDAKYYNAHLEKGVIPSYQPGIESITKQYLYQLAYQRFIEEHGFSVVRNCFLLPTENNHIEDKGEVRLEILANLGLQDIKVRFLPASMAYDLFLSEKKLNLDRLKIL